MTNFILVLCLAFLRTTDDDAATQRKVTLLLETVNRVKWKTAENVEEDKVCWVELLAGSALDEFMSLLEANNYTMFGVFSPHT